MPYTIKPQLTPSDDNYHYLSDIGLDSDDDTEYGMYYADLAKRKPDLSEMRSYEEVHSDYIAWLTYYVTMYSKAFSIIPSYLSCFFSLGVCICTCCIGCSSMLYVDGSSFTCRTCSYSFLCFVISFLGFVFGVPFNFAVQKFVWLYLNDFKKHKC